MIALFLGVDDFGYGAPESGKHVGHPRDGRPVLRPCETHDDRVGIRDCRLHIHERLLQGGEIGGILQNQEVIHLSSEIGDIAAHPLKLQSELNVVGDQE
ncbi:hypothetical protein [Azospirillum sp. B510]|uniref:hypothetical protein n=1 Tax=Azospirillum sp. (strain B510) TaxID=137722 RepID=UPI001FFF0A26|nr:hypothetical protein [Azospirillum sp. B510]